MWAIRWDCFSKTCCEQIDELLHPRGVSESFTCQRSSWPVPPPQRVSQWGDEASYGNLNPCQPTRSPNLERCKLKKSRSACSVGPLASRESNLADKKAVFRDFAAILMIYAFPKALVRAL